MPRRASSRIIACRSTRPLRIGQGDVLHVGRPCRVARTRGDDQRVRPAAPALRAASRACRSTMTRSGWRGVATRAHGELRVVRAARCRCRSGSRRRARATRARRRAPARPVIHWLPPFASAVRPSRLAAIFMRTHGRPRVMRERKPALSSRASRSSRPTSTCDAGGAQAAGAPPAASGFGSGIAATTRATPAATSASTHGGVRPVWLQGSSVT